jgi:hypothetical protein
LREKLYIGYIEHKRTKTFARGEHDAIISEDLFNTVAERMAQNASGKSGRSNASPNLLSGKLYTTDGVRFINSVTKKKDGTPSLHYYGAQKNYINTNDIDPVVQNVIRDFLNSDLSALSPDVTHTLKQINFDTLDYVSRRTLIRYLIDRAIVSDTNITFFIKPDPNTIACYTTDEFINQNAAPMNFIQTGDTIIIKRDIVFTKGNQLTKYNTGRRGLMTLTENNHLIVRAFATAWRYRELYEKCGDSDAVIATEKTSWRNLYKYLTLSYLSPKIVNALMSGTLNMPLRDIYELSTKSQDFTEQERLFYNTLKSVT